MVATSPGVRKLDRSQSAPLAIALLFAIVMISVSLVVLMSAGAITDTREGIEIERAEKAMTEMDSEMATVALGESDSQSLKLGSPSQQFTVKPDAGWIKVKWTGGPNPLTQKQLGKITYEQGQTTLAYQGGGVWKRTPSGGTAMVSPPEFHYRDRTLTLPLIVVGGTSRTFSSQATIKRLSTTTEFPTAGTKNPLESGQVTVVVQSEYYEAWGEYFETRTDGTVSYDHSANTVELALTVPAEFPDVEAAVVSGAVTSTMTIENNAQVDSYNSSNHAYTHGSAHPSLSNATLKIAGDLVLEKATVYGNVEVDGTVDFDHNHAELHDGNISYGTSLEPADPYYSVPHQHWFLPGPPSTTKYWKNNNASVAGTDPDSVSGVIDTKRLKLSDPDANDNDDENTIDASNNLDCSTDCKITAGSYYFDELNVMSNDLTLDTSSGPITIVVDGDMWVDNGQELKIQGDGRVSIYVEGNVDFRNNAQVHNPDDKTRQFWLFTNPSATITLRNNVIFRGVIYGPADGGNQGSVVDIYQNVHVLGGIVGHVNVQSQNAWIHYDEALDDRQPVKTGSDVPSVTFLHITVNKVEVDT